MMLGFVRYALGNKPRTVKAERCIGHGYVIHYGGAYPTQDEIDQAIAECDRKHGVPAPCGPANVDANGSPCVEMA
jgi:hypothetical protein